MGLWEQEKENWAKEKADLTSHLEEAHVQLENNKMVLEPKPKWSALCKGKRSDRISSESSWAYWRPRSFKGKVSSKSGSDMLRTVGKLPKLDKIPTRSSSYRPI